MIVLDPGRGELMSGKHGLGGEQLKSLLLRSKPSKFLENEGNFWKFSLIHTQSILYL
jgi:hypothetical protein